MKVFVVLSALAAVALASPGVVAPAAVTPLAYNAGFYNPLAYSYGYAAPAIGAYHAAAPAVATYAAPAYSTYAAPAVTAYAAPVAVAPVATKTQYHAQDELGQASYGYAHPGQVHNAVRDAFGNVAGSYSYVDPNGKVVKTDYIADAAGFRVASNALPVAPAAPLAPAVALPVGPAPVQDTPEVIAARAAHFAEHAAVKSRNRRQVFFSGYGSPLAYSAYNHAYAAPLAYAAAPVVAHAAPVAAVRAATLTTVVNTPGHAVSYRVD